jgi:hypothetical protein
VRFEHTSLAVRFEHTSLAVRFEHTSLAVRFERTVFLADLSIKQQIYHVSATPLFLLPGLKPVVENLSKHLKKIFLLF